MCLSQHEAGRQEGVPCHCQKLAAMPGLEVLCMPVSIARGRQRPLLQDACVRLAQSCRS